IEIQAFFFVSSRRRHTRSKRDWSSDVCSSDLGKLIKDGKPLKQADIQRIFKRGRTATRDILNELQAKGIISIQKEGRSNVFYISAEFHEKGSVRESESFTKLYQVRTREITDDLALHEAGILYKILPYFHYTEYYLVDNPDEEDTSKLRYIG